MPRLLWALMLFYLCLCISCRKNEIPFEIYFFTSNKHLPPLFAIQDNKLISPIQLRKTVRYVTDTSSNKLVTYDKEIRIDAVDQKGRVITTTKLKLHDDGTFTSTGGGYLHYEIKTIQDRVLVIDYLRQL
jgi:hypothetical protein